MQLKRAPAQEDFPLSWQVTRISHSAIVKFNSPQRRGMRLLHG